MAIGPNIPARSADSDLSPRARELNRKLADSIEEFRRYYPDTTDADVRRALMSAGRTHGGSVPKRVAAATMLAGAIAAFVGAMVASGNVGEIPQGAWIGIAGATAAVVIAIIRIARRD